MVAFKLKSSTYNPIEIHNVRTLKLKLSEFQHEINLTNEEVNILVYTSSDLDWLTNLIVLAGEFTKWFNINFAGESREEMDFRNSKVEIWKATSTYAKYIIDEYF